MANSDEQPVRWEQIQVRQKEAGTWTHPWLPDAVGVGLVAVTTLLGLPLRSFIDPTNLVMLYLLAVVLAALRLGRNHLQSSSTTGIRKVQDTFHQLR